MGDAQTVFGDTHKTGPSSMAGIRFGARKREMIALYKRRQLHPYSAAVPPAAKRKV
jgi:hypothetical protein